MTTLWPYPSSYPVSFDLFTPVLFDNVDEVIANHPNSLASAIAALQAKLGLVNEPVHEVGGVEFYAAGQPANPGAPGNPTLWANSFFSPYHVFFTDEAGTDHDLSLGGGGGGPIFTGAEEYWIDETNGDDPILPDPTRGSLNFPFKTLAYAAAHVPVPALPADFQRPVIFHVTSGVYATPATLLSRRWAYVIECTSGTRLTGAVTWQQDTDVWNAMGTSLSDYPPTLIIDGGGASFMGDLVAQRIFPIGATTPAVTKNLVVQNMYLQGTVENRASGNFNYPTGTMLAAFENCFSFGGGSAWLSSSSEAFNTPNWRRNTIILGTQSCSMLADMGGDIQIGACFDSAFGRVGVAPLPGFPMDQIIENASFGTHGFVNCKFANSLYLGSCTSALAYVTPRARYVHFDASSYVRARTSGLNYLGFQAPLAGSPLGYLLTDRAAGIGIDSTGFSGNLSASDWDLEKALATIDAMSGGGGGADDGPLGDSAIYLDAVRGNDGTANGSYAKPWKSIAGAFGSVLAPASLGEFQSTVRFCFMPGVYTVTGALPLPRRRVIEITGIGYRISPTAVSIPATDYIDWVNEDADLFGTAQWANNVRSVSFGTLMPTRSFTEVKMNLMPVVNVAIKRSRNATDPSNAKPGAEDHLEFHELMWSGHVWNYETGSLGVNTDAMLGRLNVTFDRARTCGVTYSPPTNGVIAGSYSWWTMVPPPPFPPVVNYVDESVVVTMLDSHLQNVDLMGMVRIYEMDRSIFSGRSMFSQDYQGNPYDGMIGPNNANVCMDSSFKLGSGDWGATATAASRFKFNPWHADAVTANASSLDTVLPLNVGTLIGGERPNSWFARAEKLQHHGGFPADSVVIAEQRESGFAGFFQMEGIQDAYAAAKLLTPGGAPLSTTNRAVVLVPPGQYLWTTPFVLDAEFVDVIAMHPVDWRWTETVPTVLFHDSGLVASLLRQEAQDVRLKGIFVRQAGSNAAFTVAAINGASIYESMKFDSMGAAVTVSGVAQLWGSWKNCYTKRPLFTECAFNGFAERCVGGDYSYGSGLLVGGCAGTMVDCFSGDKSFGYNAATSVTCSANLIRCHAGEYSFGSCEASVGLFLDGTFAGTAEDCWSKDYSFGYSENGNATFTGVATRCNAGQKCFGASDGTAKTALCDVGAVFTDCVAGDNSFGVDKNGATSQFSSTALRCVAGTDSFAAGGGMQLFLGTATECTSPGDSFGGATACSGTLRRCINLNRSGAFCAANGSKFYDSVFSVVNGSVMNIIADTPVFYGNTLVALDGASDAITAGFPQNIKAAQNRMNTNIAVLVTNQIVGGFNVVDANVEV